MSLSVGSRLGGYEILSLLGQGGMGEVYRARDVRLGRDVAIKILPTDVADDPDRLARFEREAQVLASLNHPHIGQIHGVEDSSGVPALVMELVEGPTVADRIAEGAIPIAEALPIARQIADALEAAHDSGVIHRDLKPANVKIRPDGTVKVLDFGLAKILDAAPVSGAGATKSPTLSLQATFAGTILGTAAYMSPEQAAGKSVDKRADIWSFGVVCWEMLTGRRLFDGETIAHTMAGVLRADIDFGQLPSDTPPTIPDLLKRGLDRDVKRRLRDIGEARIAIDRAIADPHAGATPPANRAAFGFALRRSRRIRWAIALAFAIAGVGILLPWRLSRSVSRPAAVMVTADLGADTSLAVPGAPGANLALSPKGDLFVFVGQNSSAAGTQLYIRRLDQLRATVLSGTDDARSPFFSPDGGWIAFFANGKLKKISVTGGAAITICDAQAGRGGAWAPDDTIVFTPNAAPGNALKRVPSTGGTPVPLMKLADDESSQRWPQVLPNGKGVLFSTGPSLGNWDDGSLAVKPLPDGARRVLLRGGYFGRYISSGHLVYIHGGTLFAVPFNLDRLEVIGSPVPVVESVVANAGTGVANFAASDNGTLVYWSGVGGGSDQSISWMDRNGKTEPLLATPSDWSNPRFSPDGRRLALDIRRAEGQPAISTYDWSRDQLMRLTVTSAGASIKPVWTPDGRRVTFSSTRANLQVMNLYWQRADGVGEAQRLTDSPNTQVASSWHPNGRLLAFYENRGTQTGQDVLILPVEGDDASGWKPGKPYALLSEPFDEQDAQFSPDGRWIAYYSNESGGPEVYVRPFPNTSAGKWPISSGGGLNPVWSRARHELFYRTPNQQIMVASYAVDGDTFHPEQPRLWSPGRFLVRPRLTSYDLHPDGDRFAVAAVSGVADLKQHNVVFIFNVFDELRRVAPATR